MVNLATTGDTTPWGSIVAALLVGGTMGATVMYAFLQRRWGPFLSLLPNRAPSTLGSSLIISDSNEDDDNNNNNNDNHKNSNNGKDRIVWHKLSVAGRGDVGSTAAVNEALNATASTRAAMRSEQQQEEQEQEGQEQEQDQEQEGQEEGKQQQLQLQQSLSHERRRSRRRSSLQFLLKSYMSATEAESLYSDLVNDDSLRVSFSDLASANYDSDHGEMREGSNSLRGNSVHTPLPRTTETDGSDFSTVNDLFSHEVSSLSSDDRDNDMNVDDDDDDDKLVGRNMDEPSSTGDVNKEVERKDSDLSHNLHRSSSLFCKRNQSYSSSSHLIDEQTRARLSSERDSIFSNRQFYHTVSGAIISRLPSEPSIRRMSLRQLLHSPTQLRSSKDDDNILEEGSNTSHRPTLTSPPPPPTPPSSQQINQFPSHSMRSVPDEPIYRVVITGGPCSGKTSCLSYLREVFVNLGFNVFCVPEVATLLHTGGVNLLLSTVEERITQQRVILQMMMMLEDAFYELASLRGRPSLILYDRGTMDGSAYCSEAEWRAILSVTGYTNEELCDVRYDAVVHLVTAAIGAEAAYTLANNAARSEGIDEARRMDACTRHAWRGHFLVGVVDNAEGGFERKLQRTAEFIAGVMGITLPGDKQTLSSSQAESGREELVERNRGSVTQEEKEKEKKRKKTDMVETGSSGNNNNNNTNTMGIRPVPVGVNALIPSTHAQPTAASLNVFGVCDNLQRHFFVNRVNSARIPADAVVTTVVVVTLTPLHPDYRTEMIIRLSRAHDAHPVYFRCVEFNNSAVDPLSPPTATVTTTTTTTTQTQTGEKQQEQEGERSGGQTTMIHAVLPQRRARVQITKSTFQHLARRRDVAQPVICKTMTRFFYKMRHLTLVRFSHPRELRGFCRLVAPAGTTEEDISDLVEVEPFFLLTADETGEEKPMNKKDEE